MHDQQPTQPTEKKETEPSEQQGLTLLMILYMGIFALCGMIYLAHISFLTSITIGPHGVFANLSLMTYLFAGYIAATILYQTLTSEPALKPSEMLKDRNLIKTALFFLLCIFMAAEAAEWFSAFYTSHATGPESSTALQSVRDILIAALSRTPENINLEDALMIGGVRLALLSALIYCAGYMIYNQKQGRALPHGTMKERHYYLAFFAALYLVGITVRVLNANALEVFGAGADLSASVSLVAYALTKYKTPH